MGFCVMKTISISTATFAALWAARKEGEETEDAILSRLLSGQGAAPASRSVDGGLTPQQKAAMQKQKMKKPTPPVAAKPKEAPVKKPCGPKLSTSDLDLLS